MAAEVGKEGGGRQLRLRDCTCRSDPSLPFFLPMMSRGRRGGFQIPTWRAGHAPGQRSSSSPGLRRGSRYDRCLAETRSQQALPDVGRGGVRCECDWASPSTRLRYSRLTDTRLVGVAGVGRGRLGRPGVNGLSNESFAVSRAYCLALFFSFILFLLRNKRNQETPWRLVWVGSEAVSIRMRVSVCSLFL